MNYDKNYYLRRPLEPKHFMEVQVWMDHFNPQKVLDIGCGHGHRAYCFMENEVPAYGFDFKEAIDTHPYPQLKDNLKEGTLTKIPFDETFDLIICYDVLEHLELTELDSALQEIKRVASKSIVFSIPFIGNPDLKNDPTHKIFQTREWWITELSKYFKMSDAPKTFLFYNQMLIGEI